MAWLADLAGRAEHLLNNLDESTGAAFRNHNIKRSKCEKNDNTRQESWLVKKRPPPRHSSPSKRNMLVSESKTSYDASRKSTPMYHRSRDHVKAVTDQNGPRTRKSRSKSPSPEKYHLNNCPKTLVDDVHGDNEFIDFYPKQRRFSLPSDIESEIGLPIRMQNLEVENAMLKNELNVINTETLQLVNKLRTTEDELSNIHHKLEQTEREKNTMILDKDALVGQLDEVKVKIGEITDVQKNHDDEKTRLLTRISLLQDAVKDLEERSNLLNKTKDDTETQRMRMENELRQANNTIIELQSNFNKSHDECQRLERDWAAYKLRVKNMLAAKDSEIKSLQEGLIDTEDTRELMEQLQTLRDERDDLSEAITTVQTESETIKSYLAQVETRNSAAERVVVALRDALKDERAARNRVEAQLAVYGKEIKNIQQESNQTISSLRTSLHEKEAEISAMRESALSVKATSDSSVSELNVADYEVAQQSIDREKIQHLTDSLVQKQDRVDKLLTENNILKIQLDKLESKYTTERMQNQKSHSVVNLHGDVRKRPGSDSALVGISNRMAAVIRRHPAFRIFIVIYMICLHFWVMTVLLNNTPDSHIIRPSRS